MSDREEIKKLINICKSANKTDLKYCFGKVPNYIAMKISRLTQVNIINADKFIKVNGLMHALKNHSNKKEQEKRGQLPLVYEDFFLIPEIVNNYDEVYRGNDDQHGNPGIYFIKNIKNIQFYVCMTFTTKKDRRTGEIKNRLTVSTMYKKPAKKNRTF
jgi:phage-Barnase-EndoU-ColicinE5/D-RelE like nuclease3